MEFAGNQIHIKTIALAAMSAFFAGRINLFDGTFPAAVSLITVMLAVSTVYIYFVPVLAVAMATYLSEGVMIAGDLLSIIVLGLFFLFFHEIKFSINQRTIIAISCTMICNLLYFTGKDMLFLVRPEQLIKEAFAILVYIRVFNTVVKVIYMGTEHVRLSREKAVTALGVTAVSLIGAIGEAGLVFPIWMMMVTAVLMEKGLQPAFTLTAITAIYWFCQGETQWALYPVLFCGLLGGWYASVATDRRYRKAILAGAVFLTAGLQGGVQVYGVGAAMTVFLLLPESTITRLFCAWEERFLPEMSTEHDLRNMAIQRDLMRKREAFLSLSHLYSKHTEGKEIISYQFEGMARTLEHLLRDLDGRGRESALLKENHLPISIQVGQASYAFEDVSGDSMAAFAFQQHDVALIISDGMGKGSKAAEESMLVVSTLSRLLQAGFDVDLAMKTINGILMANNDEERFATVDLAIIDRKKSRAKIFKMGAATTFIKHDGRVSMLKRQALPAGITQGLQLEYIDVKLKKGDFLIMVSDGITDCDRKDPGCDWLRSRLLEMQSKDPETIAELIVNKAAEKYGIHERDDLSVIVAAIDV